MCGENADVNLLSRLLRREGDIEDREERHQSRVNFVVSTSGRSDATNVPDALNLAKLEITSPLVEFITADQKFKESIGLLGSILINLWHV